MDENRFRSLGRTGLKMTRPGAACSNGAPTAAFEEAFEQWRQGHEYMHFFLIAKQNA